MLSVLLAALVVGASLESGGRDERTATRPTTPSTAGLPPSRMVSRSIAAASPTPPTVRARAGDVVKLAILSSAVGTVTLDGYDRIEPVGPQSPARFSFIAERAGSFAVRLRQSAAVSAGAREGPQGRRIGLLVIEEAQPRE